ncbi:hypothetical protein B0H11DRAFT_2218480 [Mycena galericulata]|nr:hypothetical protein B0H11DRAFT_2218480 [Mycena galericulata]
MDSSTRQASSKLRLCAGNASASGLVNDVDVRLCTSKLAASGLVNDRRAVSKLDLARNPCQCRQVNLKHCHTSIEHYFGFFKTLYDALHLLTSVSKKQKLLLSDLTCLIIGKTFPLKIDLGGCALRRAGYIHYALYEVRTMLAMLVHLSAVLLLVISPRTCVRMVRRRRERAARAPEC